MDLGVFSISLAVADLAKSKAFYEALGFEQFGGDEAQNWVMMQSGNAKIGLFQGMFDGNLLTFNPPDARAIESSMKASGYAFDKDCDPGDGPGHCVLKDPDGNTILIDQF